MCLPKDTNRTLTKPHEWYTVIIRGRLMRLYFRARKSPWAALLRACVVRDEWRRRGNEWLGARPGYHDCPLRDNRGCTCGSASLRAVPLLPEERPKLLWKGGERYVLWDMALLLVVMVGLKFCVILYS